MARVKRYLDGIKQTVIEAVKTIVLALMLVALLKGTVVEANQIISSSMTPTLIEGDFILVNKFRYGLHIPFVGRMLFVWAQPKRGDVITFLPPEKIPGGEGKVYVKRVIGEPGDKLQIIDSQLYINGVQVLTRKSSVQNHLFHEMMGGKKYNVVKVDGEYSFGPVFVPEGYVFAIGDNRDISLDSRDWGPLPIKNIEGKAEMIYFSKAITAGLENIKRIGNLL